MGASRKYTHRRRTKAALSLLVALVLAFPPRVQAQDEENTQGNAPKVDVAEIVIGHIGDSYSWHIIDIGGHHIGIDLPVIVKGKDRGWSVFSSARIAHGESYDGYSIATEGDYEGKVVQIDADGERIRPVIDISLTKNTVALFINCIVLLLVIMPLARWYRRHERGENAQAPPPPGGFRGAVEMLLTNIYDDVIKPCVGEDYKRFAPYLLTAFFFILISNLMGLLPIFPGGASVTGNIAVTLILALFTFVIVNFSGTREYWKEILWPDVPIWLKIPIPIMPAIELFGIFTKPFALMIRLFANIMAGHAVILGLMCIIFVTASMGTAINAGMSAVSIIFTIFMNVLELLVAYIQAYVFTLLSAVFIGMARVKHGH